ncbi:hypothetical protein D3C81_2117790 [compost metagenome]
MPLSNSVDCLGYMIQLGKNHPAALHKVPTKLCRRNPSTIPSVELSPYSLLQILQ